MLDYKCIWNRQVIKFGDEQLWNDHTHNARGSLTGKSEEEDRAAINNLAFRQENKIVAQVILLNM